MGGFFDVLLTQSGGPHSPPTARAACEHRRGCGDVRRRCYCAGRDSRGPGDLHRTGPPAAPLRDLVKQKPAACECANGLVLCLGTFDPARLCCAPAAQPLAALARVDQPRSQSTPAAVEGPPHTHGTCAYDHHTANSTELHPQASAPRCGAANTNRRECPWPGRGPHAACTQKKRAHDPCAPTPPGGDVCTAPRRSLAHAEHTRVQ